MVETRVKKAKTRMCERCDRVIKHDPQWHVISTWLSTPLEGDPRFDRSHVSDLRIIEEGMWTHRDCYRPALCCDSQEIRS